MKRAFVALVSLWLAAPPTARAAGPADLVFVGEHIITMTAPDHRVGALAVRGENIVWTGPSLQAAPWIGPQTDVIQLGERALLPGFIDAHGHLTYQAAVLGLANVASPPVGPVTDIAALQRTLTDHAAARPPAPGAWIIGNGYDDSLLAEQRHPNRDDLDAVSSNHPVAVFHVSGHLAAVNSAALQAIGYDAGTADPAGGHIRRRPGSREPNGVLEETAIGPVRARALAPSGDPLDALARALALYASRGITTVQDGALTPPGRTLLDQAAGAGRLTLDVVGYPMVTTATADLPVADGGYRQRLKIGGIKLVLDGSPQGKTAFLTHPYHVPPAGQDEHYRGYPTLPQQTVNALVAAALQAGVPVIAHANGDAAADMLLDAVAASGAAERDHRTVMIHAQTVRDDQLTRMAELGVVPSFFVAHTFYWGDWHRDSVLGAERAARISPARSALVLGLPVTVHNDAPIVPPDMLRLLWTATNRITRSGAVLGPEERLSTFEALQTITVHAARQHFDEAIKGRLEPGMLADLVMLSADPLTVPAPRLMDLQVEATWARGRRVYDAAQPIPDAGGWTSGAKPPPGDRKLVVWP
jgi:predicted amidohydrolase YtcJ